VIPVTDAEQAAAEAQERDEPTVARIDPEAAAQWRAEQTARVEAGKQARHAESARRIPVTDAEVAKYAASPQLEFSDSSGRHSGEVRTPELDEVEATMAEMRGEVEALAADLDELAARDAEAEAARCAEMDQAGIDEPVQHQPQAEAELDASWQPGTEETYSEAQPAEDAEPELGA
jgi:hypothetical protein